MGWGDLGRRWSAVSLAWRLNAAIVIVAVLLILAIRLGVEPTSTGFGDGCVATSETEERDVEEQAVLIPRDGSPVSFQWVFDADETVKKFPTVLDWQNPPQRPASVDKGDQLEVAFSEDLQNEDNDESIPLDQVSATAVVTGNGVALSVCIDTSGAPPDRYTSTVYFVDRDVKAGHMAIDVTVKHRAEWVPFSAIVAGFALSLIVLVLSVSDDENVKPARIIGLALAALIVAVGTARPWEAWQDNPTWGKSRFDFWTLIAATALAFTGAMVASTTIPGLRKAAEGTNGPKSPKQDAGEDGASTGTAEPTARGTSAAPVSPPTPGSPDGSAVPTQGEGTG